MNEGSPMAQLKYTQNNYKKIKIIDYSWVQIVNFPENMIA